MRPFYFGTRARRLFGVYHPAQGKPAAPDARGAVLCNPWGQEYLCAHRSIRLLAMRLSAAGTHVLRFDYFGTGDSAADMADADLPGWESDIRVAIDELKDTADVARVGLVGLRLGALLAASVATTAARDVSRLVLWDPVGSGAEYLAELRTLVDPPGSRDPQHGGGIEVQGFALTQQFADALARTPPLIVPDRLAAQTLIIRSGSSAAAPRPSIPEESVQGPAAWTEDQHAGVGAIPAELLSRIAQWWGS